MSEQPERNAIAQILAVRNNMPRCDTCRWWEGSDGEAGPCNVLSEDCNAPVAGVEVDRPAVVSTPPNFGCTAWEPHDTEGDA